MTKKIYRCIGIMTGNSLDAVDVVLTEFNDTTIKDIAGFSQDIPTDIATRFRNLKTQLTKNGGNINQIASDPQSKFQALHNDYISLVANTVNKLIEQSDFAKSNIDIIGFHGQTCAHLPPSISTDGQTYTLQVGSGQMLADLTNLPVAFDFRSDDLMNGGEAAPLAPVHNQHLAQDLKAKKIFPIAFCNAGNTGNLTIVSTNTNTNKEIVMGWDTGPFNHFIDYLARHEKNQPCDFDGQYGKTGKINDDLLAKLFEKSTLTQNGENFLLKSPPKSSDPAWYQIIPEMVDENISFNDRIRTAEFFSSYIYVYNLKHIPSFIEKPKHFLVFGGGWRNPIVMNDFKQLLQGTIKVLPEHQEIFAKLTIKHPIVEWSDQYGYSGQFMEARIFADMARCRLTNEPFSYPKTTGCKTPTIGGLIAHPGGSNPQQWSRAALGWNKA